MPKNSRHFGLADAYSGPNLTTLQLCQPGDPGTCLYQVKSGLTCGLPCNRFLERRGHVCRCIHHGRNRWEQEQQSANVSQQAILATEVSQQAVLAQQSAEHHGGRLNHQQLLGSSKQNGDQDCPKRSVPAAAAEATDGLTEQSSMMMAKMQELADSGNVAASAAKEAVEQLAAIKKQSDGGSFRSAASAAGNGAKQERPAAPL